MTLYTIKKDKGDCECCPDSKDVTLYHMNSMDMCESCRDKQLTAVATYANNVIEESRQIDSTIKLSTDILKTKSTAIETVVAAIDSNPTIPSDMKTFEKAKACSEHRRVIQEAIFNKRQELNEMQNDERLWQTNAQHFAGMLRADLKAQFTALDVNYAPVVKTVKSKKPKSDAPSSSSLNKAALKAAAEKYGVDMAKVRLIQISHPGWTADEAAKHWKSIVS